MVEKQTSFAALEVSPSLLGNLHVDNYFPRALRGYNRIFKEALAAKLGVDGDESVGIDTGDNAAAGASDLPTEKRSIVLLHSDHRDNSYEYMRLGMYIERRQWTCSRIAIKSKSSSPATYDYKFISQFDCILIDQEIELHNNITIGELLMQLHVNGCCNSVYVVVCDAAADLSSLGPSNMTLLFDGKGRDGCVTLVKPIVDENFTELETLCDKLTICHLLV
jgi:hypothetical protein